MNRKHNPWVALIALLLLLVLIVTICTGCGAADEGTTDRFIIEHTQSSGVNLRIITDTETGVQYLLVGNANGYGLTVLQEETP